MKDFKNHFITLLMWLLVAMISITAVMVVVATSIFYWQKLKKPETVIRTITNSQVNESQPLDEQSVVKLLLFNQEKNEIVTVIPGKTAGDLFYKIDDQNIREVKYKKDHLVYIKTDNNTDKLIDINIKTSDQQEIDSKYHGYEYVEGEKSKQGVADVVKNEGIRCISEFSPNAYYITYHTVGWEWGYDSIRNLESKDLLLKSSENIKWSPDGKRIVVFSTAGMATSNRFALSQKGNIKNIVDVDFEKVNGDVDKISFSSYQGKKYLISGFISADFINQDQIVFAGVDCSSNNDCVYNIFIYDEPSNYLKNIQTIKPLKYQYLGGLVYLPRLNSVLVGNYFNYPGEKGHGCQLFLIDPKSGTKKEVTLPVMKEFTGYCEMKIEDKLMDGKTVVLEVNDVSYRDGKKELISQKLFSLDLETNQHNLLSEDEQVSYVGYVE